jgi:hypothetical protein
MCSIILAGCSAHEVKNKPIYQSTTEMKEIVDQGKWKKAKNKVEEMHHLFHKNKWKYRFMGDEREYGGLEEEISRLQISIEEQDKLEAKKSIALIELYIQSLYFK